MTTGVKREIKGELVVMMCNVVIYENGQQSVHCIVCMLPINLVSKYAVAHYHVVYPVMMNYSGI